GSQDPYALRRQALGILNIVTDGNIHFALTRAIKETLSRLPKTDQSEDKLAADIVEFFAQRSKNMMLDRGVRYDIVDAVLGAEGRDDLCDAFAAADALTAYLGTEKAPETLQAFTRVENITKKNRVEAPISEPLLKEDAEKALFEAVKKAAETVHGRLLSRDFAGVLTACDSLSAPINRFFDDVMVMDKDEAVKQNRLALLTKIRSLIGCVGDVSLLVMK
ncbi:glycine--tRNA ligase subunit beta, partial [uncultured Acidaminococcus sp.]|uniref:glycine--tRNA ligase subunit beta n=1 Tax=uncultured Acidaminococcus sp. TaxID=352152 RepID=UPI0025F07ADC